MAVITLSVAQTIKAVQVTPLLCWEKGLGADFLGLSPCPMPRQLCLSAESRGTCVEDRADRRLLQGGGQGSLLCSGGGPCRRGGSPTSSRQSAWTGIHALRAGPSAGHRLWGTGETCCLELPAPPAVTAISAPRSLSLSSPKLEFGGEAGSCLCLRPILRQSQICRFGYF